MVESLPATADEPRSPWYASAMESLVGVVQALSQARDVETVRTIVRDAARSLTGADGATFVLRDGDQCHYVDENAIGPLWKGRRFPMTACISGWTMLNARSAVIEDIYADPRIPADAYRPTFVKSLAMVPIRRAAPIGAIGNYWATRRQPTEEEVAILQALADTTSVALENANLYEELRGKIRTLEEQRARIDEQRDALEVFTHALAHDLKEPVRTVRTFSEMIGRSELTAKQTSQYLAYVQKAAHRMGMLIETVFQYTQLDDSAETPKGRCAMAEALQAARENLAWLITSRGAVIASGPLPEVPGSPVQMIQLLQNLLSNAVRHGNGPAQVTVRCDEQTDRWLFSVTDNGPGVAAEDAERIFLPFKRLTRDEDCAGLGLAICRKIITAHGGSIWCEPTEHKGATFRFTLPKAADVVKASDQPANPPANPVAGRAQTLSLATVLLVDDRDDDIELTRHFLFDETKTDCHVQVALDGEEALKILRAESRENPGVDLMLLDINMPGMDGFELLERVRRDQSLCQLPVVMCTGSTYDKDRRRAEALGVAGYLVKPPSFESFAAIMQGITTPRLDCGTDGGKLLRAG